MSLHKNEAIANNNNSSNSNKIKGSRVYFRGVFYYIRTHGTGNTFPHPHYIPHMNVREYTRQRSVTVAKYIHGDICALLFVTEENQGVWFYSGYSRNINGAHIHFNCYSLHMLRHFSLCLYFLCLLNFCFFFIFCSTLFMKKKKKKTQIVFHFRYISIHIYFFLSPTLSCDVDCKRQMWLQKIWMFVRVIWRN